LISRLAAVDVVGFRSKPIVKGILSTKSLGLLRFREHAAPRAGDCPQLTVQLAYHTGIVLRANADRPALTSAHDPDLGATASTSYCSIVRAVDLTPRRGRPVRQTSLPYLRREDIACFTMAVPPKSRRDIFGADNVVLMVLAAARITPFVFAGIMCTCLNY